jgi:hypothetical protein
VTATPLRRGFAPRVPTRSSEGPVPDRHTLQDRGAAIADLFTGLEEILFAYQFLPEAERRRRLAADADRITGEIARRLAATRTRLSPSFDPAPVSDP